MDRDLIDAKAKRWREGEVVGLFDSSGKYWRVSSGVGVVMFTPTTNSVASGEPRPFSRERFRKEFC